VSPASSDYRSIIGNYHVGGSISVVMLSFCAEVGAICAPSSLREEMTNRPLIVVLSLSEIEERINYRGRNRTLLAPDSAVPGEWGPRRNTELTAAEAADLSNTTHSPNS
jgi:hypothetical protein